MQKAMYHVLLTWITQVNDITKIQLENPNKNNIITEYNINLSVEQIFLHKKIDGTSSSLLK